MASTSEWILLKKDFSKKVISGGTKGKRPRFWSEVDGRLRRIPLDSELVEATSPIDLSPWQEFFKLRIGVTNDEWSRIVDTSLQLIDEGEVSEFRAKMRDGTLIGFQLHLIKIVSQAQLLPFWEVSQVVEVSRELKQLAVSLFKEKKTIDSFYLFSRAVKTLIPVETLLARQLAVNSENKDETTEHTKKEITAIVASLYSNLAACQLLESNYEHVLHLCDQALNRDPSDLKAIYRKGSALIGKFQFN